MSLRAITFGGIVHLLVATLVAQAADTRWADPAPFPPIPEAVSSFGAASSDHHLYIFSGHMGRAAGNSVDGLSPHFSRLDTSKPGSKWEDLPMHKPSQSPGLLSWNGSIYRVGGLSFKNKAGEETVFNSLDAFARFDPKTNQWTDLPSLPEPRSSLDAAIVDGKLYVVGGWNLQGASSANSPWHTTALVFDLTKEDGKWTEIAQPPFVTRALAAIGLGGKLYVMGGMHEDNGISKEVHIYDPKSNAWSKGPDLPGKDRLAGFAISAAAVGNRIYFNGSEGIVYSLGDGESQFKPVERLLFPRSFHRLVAAPNDQLVVIAGVSRGGYLANVEVVNVGSNKQSGPKLAQWSIDFGGAAKHSQVLHLNGSLLYAFGGNRSRAPHDFSKEAFLSEAFRFDLAARSFEKLANLPTTVQSGGAYLSGSRIDQSIYVLGGIGFGPDAKEYGSSADVLQYRMRSKAWSDENKLKLPASRAMFNVASYGGAAWIFGGSEVNSAHPGLASDTWTWSGDVDESLQVVPEAKLPISRRSFGGAVLGDKYYLVGGLGEDAKIVATASVYDFKNKTWSEIASPMTSRVFCSLAASGGKLYLSGGFARIDGHFQAVKEVEVFDPATGKWSIAFKELPLAKGNGAVMLEFQDRLLFYGIDEGQEGLAHFAVLDPSPESTDFGVTTSSGQFEDSGAAAADLVKRLLKMDKNADGKLSKEEVGERYQRLIARADKDNDGVASKEEIEAIAKSEAGAGNVRGGFGGGLFGGGGGGNSFFADNDVNKDGKLTRDELPERMRDNFERVDTNKDGALDKSEVETWLQSFRNRSGGENRPGAQPSSSTN